MSASKLFSIYRSGMVVLLASLPTLMAFGWGQKGHDTVAAIAEAHLTDKTAAVIDSLLDGKSIVYWANWLDNASHTSDYYYTKTWHYKNIDADKNFDTMEPEPKGDIVTALNEQVAILADPNVNKNDKALALKIVVHLMGDLHQPMHLGRKTDRGGNNYKVKYFDKDNKLHTVWDSYIPEAAHKWSHTEWVHEIDRISDTERAKIQEGNPDKWARETYEICKQVYTTTPVGTNVSYNYIAGWTPTIEQQWLKGGSRLADLLNSAFDPDYKGNNSLLGK